MIRYLVLFVFLGLTLALPFVFFGEELEAMFAGDGALQLLNANYRYGWLLAIGLLVGDLVLPIPTTAIFAALGIVYGPWLGGAISAAGSFIAGLTGYLLCRRFGAPMAERIAGPDAMQYGEGIFKRAGGLLVAFSRWLPLLPEVVSCLAGLSRMRLGVFVVALLCGVIPVGFVFAAVGHTGADRPVLTLLLSALAPVLLWFLIRPTRFLKQA